jgi:hypothetical protein
MGSGEDKDPLGRLLRSLVPAGCPVIDLAAAPEPPSLPGASAVICVAPSEPPPADAAFGEFGQPSRHDTALAWVQVCLARTAEGGTAIVAVPFAVAVRASGRRIRAELLRAGVLHQVVGLPDLPSGPWQIWSLSRPGDQPTYQVRMVDLSDHDPDSLPATVADWDAIYADQTCTRTVPSIELLDEDVLLVPSGHVIGEATDIRPAHDAARASYAELVARLAPQAPAQTEAGASPSWPLTAITDLIRIGSLAVLRGKVEPGDVLVRATHGEFSPVVVTEATDDTHGATILRCQPDLLDPYFLAGFLRSEINRRRASGTAGGTYRLDVKRARVPRMPLPEQRRYGDAFRELMSFDAAAAAVAQAAHDLTRTAIQGLTNGTYAPQS